jgi:hypothetical protein
MNEHNKNQPKESTIKNILEFSKSITSLNINRLENKIICYLN